MINEKKNYKVYIFDDQYVLISDRHEAFVKKAADMVDTFMNDIIHQTTALDPKKVAVLAALRMADTLLITEQIYNEEQKKQAALIEYIDHELSLVSM